MKKRKIAGPIEEPTENTAAFQREIEEILQRVKEALNDHDDESATKAANELVNLAAEPLRRRAHQILRPGDPVNQRVSPTGLLNDVYEGILRVIKATTPASWKDVVGLVNLKLRQRLIDIGRTVRRERRLLRADPVSRPAGPGTEQGDRREDEDGGKQMPPSQPFSGRVARDRASMDPAEWDEFCRAMKKFLEELDSQQRRVLYYLDVQKWTQKQVAKQIGKDESTVKRIYRRLKPPIFDLMAKHLSQLGSGDLASIPVPEKCGRYDFYKAEIVDAFWCECEAGIGALSREEIDLIDSRWTWGLSTQEAAELLNMDSRALEEKWEDLLMKVSPTLRDLLRK
jgi:RNA polymerase sigma factor (sigma-70 family)